MPTPTTERLAWLLAGVFACACSPSASAPRPAPSDEPTAPAAATETPTPSSAATTETPTPSPEPVKAVTMPTIDFGLADDDYWTDPRKTKDQVIKALWALDGDHVAIGAPSFVSISAREQLPLMVYRGASYRELWAMSLREYGQVVAIELEHNRMRVGPVVADDEAVSKKKLDPAKAPGGQGSAAHLAELRGDLGLDWQPSTYLITVLMREHASNRVRVELGKQAGAYHDEEVAKFIAEQRAQPSAPAVSPAPGDPVPSYAAIAGSPAIPDAPGIALVGDRVVVDTPGARALLRGAFRLPVLPAERRADGSAVVGIGLVVNASDQPASGVLHLQVPAAVEGELATGYFAVDLIAEGLTSGAQTYFVFAFSGEQMAGPAPVALVSESML